MADLPAHRPGLHRRLRRLRATEGLRLAVADVTIPRHCLIYPIFVSDNQQTTPVASMPGVQQWPVAAALEQMRQWIDLGLTSFLLFGVTPGPRKNATGDYALSPDCPVNRLLALAREADLPATLIADACFCEYTDHGHCGILTADAADPMVVDNDRTLEQLGRLAVAQAKAGAEIIAPSGMMDGGVAAIRAALDAAGFAGTAIMGYSVKYCSSFYGPFREAGGCTLEHSADRPTHRRAYQMDYRRSREWRSELEADIAEGADIVMVKPALCYLDVIRQVRDACCLPVAAYQVSGEYAMLHAASQRGWLDLKQTALESTYAIRRAGADLVISYFAPQILQWRMAE
ncbi:MAG: porphobilinogen synthase [Phycisphaeraceae bacterium]|nr:porphobilinogen synthase [Phycisphaeraceae bacterium]